MDLTSACNGRIKTLEHSNLPIPDYRFLTLRKVWLIIKKNGGITSANPAWDMFSAYNGMAAGFFNGDWGVLLIWRWPVTIKMTSSPPRAS